MVRAIRRRRRRRKTFENSMASDARGLKRQRVDSDAAVEGKLRDQSEEKEWVEHHKLMFHAMQDAEMAAAEDRFQASHANYEAILAQRREKLERDNRTCRNYCDVVGFLVSVVGGVAI